MLCKQGRQRGTARGERSGRQVIQTCMKNLVCAKQMYRYCGRTASYGRGGALRVALVGGRCGLKILPGATALRNKLWTRLGWRLRGLDWPPAQHSAAQLSPNPAAGQSLVSRTRPTRPAQRPHPSTAAHSPPTHTPVAAQHPSERPPPAPTCCSLPPHTPTHTHTHTCSSAAPNRAATPGTDKLSSRRALIGSDSTAVATSAMAATAQQARRDQTEASAA